MREIAIVFLVCCLFVPFASIGLGNQENWWHAEPLGVGSWDYRKPILIQASKVDSDLTNFPVLISITDTDLRDNAQPDGDDICFVNVDNTVRLDHEIEKFDGLTGELVAWVKIPFLSSTTNTTIYMYYGRSDCESQENSTGVWDSHYKIVQHLEETSGTHYDSTSNNNNGTSEGGVTQGVTGKIDGADYFDGNYAFVIVTDDPSLNPTSCITAEAWVKLDSFGNYSRLVSKGQPWEDGGYHINVEVDRLRFGVRTEGAERSVPASDTISLGQWYYVVGTYNGSNVNIYMDGTLSNSFSVTGEMETSDKELYLGCAQWETFFLNGTLDEVRISDIARDASWIKTCYNNMNDPSKFIEVGAEQSSPVQPIPEFPSTLILPLFMIATLLAVVIFKRKQLL